VSRDPIDVVRDQFAATNERNFERAMDLYADDVVLVVPEVEGVPNPGIYEGKEVVGEWFGDWFRTFAPGYHFELEDFQDLGDGLVMLYATHGGTGRLSGAEVHGENAYLYRVRGGRIVKVGFFATREEALDAAPLPEWSDPETD
jgi:ketosteroid isomerase-like protein